MRFHLVALPHAQTTKAYSACAFTWKVRGFAQMMMARGHEVILYAGEDITGRPQTWRARAGIMMIPEGRQLYSGLPVEDNLIMGAYTRRDSAGVRRDLEWVYTILPVLKERRRQLAARAARHLRRVQGALLVPHARHPSGHRGCERVGSRLHRRGAAAAVLRAGDGAHPAQG